ncbi:MAG: hypothetical protein ACE141_06020 [Bryobacteraceae bacterium]
MPPTCPHSNRGPLKPPYVFALDDLSPEARACLASLPVKQRIVWSFRYLEGRLMPVVADIMDLDESHAWDLHDAAVNAIREAITSVDAPLSFRARPWRPPQD